MQKIRNSNRSNIIKSVFFLGLMFGLFISFSGCGSWMPFSGGNEPDKDEEKEARQVESDSLLLTSVDELPIVDRTGLQIGEIEVKKALISIGNLTISNQKGERKRFSKTHIVDMKEGKSFGDPFDYTFESNELNTVNLAFTNPNTVPNNLEYGEYLKTSSVVIVGYSRIGDSKTPLILKLNPEFTMNFEINNNDNLLNKIALKMDISQLFDFSKSNLTKEILTDIFESKSALPLENIATNISRNLLKSISYVVSVDQSDDSIVEPSLSKETKTGNESEPSAKITINEDAEELAKLESNTPEESTPSADTEEENRIRLLKLSIPENATWMEAEELVFKMEFDREFDDQQRLSVQFDLGEEQIQIKSEAVGTRKEHVFKYQIKNTDVDMDGISNLSLGFDETNYDQKPPILDSILPPTNEIKVDGQKIGYNKVSGHWTDWLKNFPIPFRVAIIAQQLDQTTVEADNKSIKLYTWYDPSNKDTLTISESGRVHNIEDLSPHGQNAIGGASEATDPKYNIHPINGLPTLSFDAQQYLYIGEPVLNQETGVRESLGDIHFFMTYQNVEVTPTDVEWSRTISCWDGQSQNDADGSGFAQGWFDINGLSKAEERQPDLFVSRVIKNRKIKNCRLGMNARWTSEFNDMEIGEILLYGVELSGEPQEILEGYLAHKWGIQGKLPENHPYKSSAP